MKEYSEDDIDDSSCRRRLSNEEKLCKCLLELLETEQEYVKVCTCFKTNLVSKIWYFPGFG